MDRILAARCRGGSIADDAERLCAPAQAVPRRLKPRAGRAGGRLRRLWEEIFLSRPQFTLQASMLSLALFTHKGIKCCRLHRLSEL